MPCLTRGGKLPLGILTDFEEFAVYDCRVKPNKGDAASVVLPRTVWLYAVKDLDELAARLAPLAGRIQSLGYAGEADSEALARLSAELGVSRVAPLGGMAWPPVDWRHDGRHRLLPLLSWTDWERRP